MNGAKSFGAIVVTTPFFRRESLHNERTRKKKRNEKPRREVTAEPRRPESSKGRDRNRREWPRLVSEQQHSLSWDVNATPRKRIVQRNEHENPPTASLKGPERVICPRGSEGHDVRDNTYLTTSQPILKG